MVKYMKLSIFLFAFTFGFIFLTMPVNATTMNFKVGGGKEVTKSFDLAVEDHVLIKFSVVASSDEAIHFYLVYPNGTVKNFGDVGNFDYSFVCDLEGEYVLRFSNVDSNEEKLVTLNFSVEHYIFGFPQMFFLTMLIAIICVATVASYVLIGKTF